MPKGVRWRFPLVGFFFDQRARTPPVAKGVRQVVFCFLFENRAIASRSGLFARSRWKRIYEPRCGY
jgi:hypothetical protein